MGLLNFNMRWHHQENDISWKTVSRQWGLQAIYGHNLPEVFPRDAITVIVKFQCVRQINMDGNWAANWPCRLGIDLVTAAKKNFQVHQRFVPRGPLLTQLTCNHNCQFQNIYMTLWSVMWVNHLNVKFVRQLQHAQWEQIVRQQRCVREDERTG